MRRIVFFAIVTLFALSRYASAQDTPRFGVVMGYPGQVGVLWNVSSRFAVRPEINWSQSHSETTTTTSSFTFTGTLVVPTTIETTSTSDGWQVGVGVSGLLYLSKGDALRTYVSPRYVYSRTSATIDLGIRSLPIPVASGPVTTVIANHGASGSFGAQYQLGKRFGVFGELGLSYTHTGNRSTQPVSPLGGGDASGWTLGLRSGAGVILFFGK
jgi:hypothetical protein